MRTKERSIAKLEQILSRHLYADPNTLKQLAERIYWEVVAPAMEDIRMEVSFNLNDVKRDADGGDH